uniref:Histone-lysine N-methyltransferase 2C n=1 Tax=Schistocephalus solidus TaxID=70667 RepID=A0A0X3PJK8_SCHSO
MESNPNEAQMYMSPVSGVSSSPAVALFGSRHQGLMQNPKQLPQGFCSMTDNFIARGNWQSSGTCKRKLSISPSTCVEKPTENLSNGSPARSDGNGHVLSVAPCLPNPPLTPVKRLCLSKSPPCDDLPNPFHQTSLHLPPSPVENADLALSGVHAVDSLPISDSMRMTSGKCPLEPTLVGQPIEPMRMNLQKLENTIEHVLALARSDEPCEDIFVLPCRTRECAPTPSPHNPGSTPTSSLNLSPSFSPVGSPKHPQMSSPAFSVSNVSSTPLFVPSIPFPKRVTDQVQGSIQLTKQPSSIIADGQNQWNAEVSSDRFRSPATSNGTNAAILRPQSNFTMIITSNTHETFKPMPLLHPGTLTTGSYFGGSTRPLNSTSPRSGEQRPIFSKLPTSSPDAKFLSASVSASTDSVTRSPNCQAGLSVCTPQKQLCESTHVAFPMSPVPHSSSQFPDSFPIKDAATNDPLSLKQCQPSISETYRLPETNGIPQIFAARKKSASRVSPIMSVDLQHCGNPNLKSPTSSRRRGNAAVSKRKKSVNVSAQTSVVKMAVPISATSYKVTSGSSAELPHTQTPPKQSPAVQEAIIKLTSFDPKIFLSDPAMQPFPSALPPLAAQSLPLLSPLEEDCWIRQCGLKYKRNHLAFGVVKPPCVQDDAFSELGDHYLFQRLSLLQTKPIRQTEQLRKPPTDSYRVCPSPQQVSFDNQLNTFFSGLRHTFTPPPEQDLNSVRANSPPVLHMLSRSSCLPSDPSTDRCTPPLALYHIPNTTLLSSVTQRICHASDTCKNSPQPAALYPDEVRASKDCGHLTSETGFESPLVDSETGEIVGGHRPKLKSPYVYEQEAIGESKLHVTFTIKPAMTGNIPKIVELITNLLNIDRDSVTCEITGSGGQISFPQSGSQCEGVMRDLEHKLRKHFTQLSIRVDSLPVTPAQFVDDSLISLQSGNHTSAATELLSHPRCSLASETPRPKLSSDESDAGSIQYSAKHIEEPVSVASLVASKRGREEHCRNCNALVPHNVGIKRKLDEVANVSNIVLNVDNGYHLSDDYVFCSGSCLQKFSAFLATHFRSDDGLPFSIEHQQHSGAPITYAPELPHTHVPSSTINSSDTRYHLVFGSFPWMTPVLLQTLSSKGYKAHLLSRRSLLASGLQGKRRPSPKQKRWRDVRWRTFKAESAQWRKSSEEDPRRTPKLNHILRHPVADDRRVCILCGQLGDAPEHNCGRLLCMDMDKWVHLNCALWCYEIYESVSGSLHNVEDCIKKAQETPCTHCGKLGAGLPCYNPRCSFVYHVPCAIDIGCMFFTDRGMYCPTHQPKEPHPMQLNSLVVNRKVYLTRDENSQVADVIHDETQDHRVRIGALTLHSIGQLLPHQIESGNFHTPRFIYPVHFSTSRIHWSMRCPGQRSLYRCEIIELNNRPLFQVTAIDAGLPDIVLRNESCDGVWKKILSDICQLRRQNNLVQLFPEHLHGEDLFGLSEPHIVRAIESLPGVDTLVDYAFHFGRLQLISEMPLAINPSGCARAEPNLRTYLRRKRAFVGPHEKQHSASGPQFPSCALSTSARRFPSLVSSDPSLWPKGSLSDMVPKTAQCSKSQQYRRLKMDFQSNVVFGRSRIQGFGLFAARDLEQNTIVIEYIGELIRLELANKREKEYEARNRGIYMFRLEDNTVIDATMCGGPARYINHSCQPNCFTEYVNFNDEGHIVIVTKRKIDKGEELTYDYQFDLEDKTNKLPCLCGAIGCKKWMN